jgi:hypothetical protein
MGSNKNNNIINYIQIKFKIFIYRTALSAVKTSVENSMSGNFNILIGKFHTQSQNGIVVFLLTNRS